MKRTFVLANCIVILFVLLVMLSCSKVEGGKPVSEEGEIADTGGAAKVTFIELGSVDCVPCKMMQPVMKALEENFPLDVDVVFYDVWTPEEKQYGGLYKIRAIPTQVFLDENGEEFYRHEGFFPYEDIVKLIKTKGARN